MQGNDSLLDPIMVKKNSPPVDEDLIIKEDYLLLLLRVQ
jgi:hypothetical protein